MARPRTRDARSIGEAPSKRTVAESESETHGVGLPPPTYAITDQFETLQTQMTTMMALLHNQIHTNADHVSSPPIAPTENIPVQPPQRGLYVVLSIPQHLAEDPVAPAVDRGAPHLSVEDHLDRPLPPPHFSTLDLEQRMDEMMTQKIESALTKRRISADK
ncbi:hypothetical protein Adt_33055 [Abeliophyllum distichum]|uniref:Uncharacterized protein n=1 Tax=Abeliophyllum distichum TaxID=126358 RepID=A0ABD1QW20_9LAMI